jgi:YrbI family 3-deoxy-D-manno-octulosonate 8-phosphate phosphatase
MIKLVLFDIDGVLTNGRVTIDSHGNEHKTINFKDLDAIAQMKQQGLKVGLVTGENTPIVQFFRDRFKPDFFYSGCKNKVEALQEIMAQTGFSAEHVCYLGDGKYDIPAMQMVKFPACPADAIGQAKALAKIKLTAAGGEGCAWELLEWIIKNEEKA